jgi:hypothetical protein
MTGVNVNADDDLEPGFSGISQDGRNPDSPRTRGTSLPGIPGDLAP